MHLNENISNAKKDFEELLKNPYDENDKVKVYLTDSDADQSEDYFDKGRNNKKNIGLKFVSDNYLDGSFYNKIKK